MAEGRRLEGPVRAVILGWSGVIVDPGCRARGAAVVEVLKARGVEVSASEAREAAALQGRDHLRQLLALPAVGERWAAAKKDPPSDTDLDALAGELREAEVKAAKKVELVPGAAEAIADLRARGLLVAVTSHAPRAVLDAGLKASGLTVDASVAGDEVAGPRPAPWLAFRAAEKLGVYPLSQCIHVGHSEEDVTAGQHAGAWSVGVARTGAKLGLGRDELAEISPSELKAKVQGVRDDFELIGAAAIIDDLGELPAAIDRARAPRRTVTAPEVKPSRSELTMATGGRLRVR